MKTVRKTFLLLTAFSLFANVFATDPEILWWRVQNEDDPESFENVKVTALDGSQVKAVDLDYQGKSVNAARLRVIGGGVDTYLQFADPAVPAMSQTFAPLPGDFYNDLSGYTGAAYSFAVELGNWEDDSWTIMASSGYVTFDTLKNEMHHVYNWSNIDTNIAMPWLPSFTVPEPCSGLLLLLGGGLLALRRRRRA